MISLTPLEQRGVVPGSKLHNHLFEVHVTWRTMDSGIFVRVDFAKAFNSVSHVCVSPFFRKVGLPPGNTGMLLFLF